MSWRNEEIQVLKIETVLMWQDGGPKYGMHIRYAFVIQNLSESTVEDFFS